MPFPVSHFFSRCLPHHHINAHPSFAYSFSLPLISLHPFITLSFLHHSFFLSLTSPLYSFRHPIPHTAHLSPPISPSFLHPFNIILAFLHPCLHSLTLPSPFNHSIFPMHPYTLLFTLPHTFLHPFTTLFFLHPSLLSPSHPPFTLSPSHNPYSSPTSRSFCLASPPPPPLTGKGKARK